MPLTWGEAFAEVEAASAEPRMTPAEQAAAWFVLLREVIAEQRAALTHADLFEQAA